MSKSQQARSQDRAVTLTKNSSPPNAPPPPFGPFLGPSSCPFHTSGRSEAKIFRTYRSASSGDLSPKNLASWLHPRRTGRIFGCPGGGGGGGGGQVVKGASFLLKTRTTTSPKSKRTLASLPLPMGVLPQPQSLTEPSPHERATACTTPALETA